MRIRGMSSMSATQRIAASETQPSFCSCARHRIAIAADACRPCGYLVISRLAQARFSSVKAKLSGCCSSGARRRTDICSRLSLHATRGIGVERIDPVLPERALRAEDVVADVGGDLDAVEDRQLGHGLQAVGPGIVDDELERCLFEDVARHGVV